LHDLGQGILPVWRHQQVDMVGHQHVCVEAATELVGRGSQGMDVIEIVGFSEEAGLAIVPTLDYMLGYARQMKSWFPWHRLP
jgi:hypothetical protein